jgi:hypothetical protein
MVIKKISNYSGFLMLHEPKDAQANYEIEAVSDR